MLCPYCQNEMTQGYIQCRDGLFWTPERALVSALSGMKKGAVPLQNNPEYPSNTTSAYFCQKCRKVIMDIK